MPKANDGCILPIIVCHLPIKHKIEDIDKHYLYQIFKCLLVVCLFNFRCSVS